MLNSIQLNQSLSKQDYKAAMEQLIPEISSLQRQIRAAGIPVTIVFEGIDMAGKGVLINELISAMDPRGYAVVSTERETEDEKRHPFLWRFWKNLPAKGRIQVFDRSWYRKVMQDPFEHTLSSKDLDTAFKEIINFERLLTDGGMVIIKFFLVISEKEQTRRLNNLTDKRETMWRVKSEEIKHNKHYNRYLNICQDMIVRTESNFAPWTIVESTDRRFAAVKIMRHVAAVLKDALMKKAQEQPALPNALCDSSLLDTSILDGMDLSKSLTREEYTKRMKNVQKRLESLHNQIYEKQLPVVLVFEGQDAAGKGGAIKRLTKKLDPRGYEVIPTSAANAVEKQYHYLWRFWTRMPKDGHIAIFDRSWYGRVMVERIEGFCSEEEWKRAFRELNEMEESIAAHGTVILKFWLQIDRDEQEIRFKDRMENPEKQWKITDEDWRNREKWDQYRVAVDEMLIKTSTSYAPWIVVEANNKLYSRVKILETIADTLDSALKKL
ncbi:MAG: polyphosphate:AMP phosphotransferase [Lachnospiraceae bacterium]|nr:polyphosphate:AMP phosphotransferase [Lachnospiraceae bacterium]